MSSVYRLKTVADADLIIVLKDGYVAEQGTHADLIAKGGLYKSMWEQQNAALPSDSVVAEELPGQ